MKLKVRLNKQSWNFNNGIYQPYKTALCDSLLDYFYNYVTTNTVIWQNEYNLPKRWDLAEDWVTVLDGLTNVKSVSWKINSTDTEYTVLRPIRQENLEKDIESYDETSSPFFCLMDNSVFIYPAPKEATQLKIYGNVHYKKVVWADEERLPDTCVRAIFYWVKEMFLEWQNRVNEAQVAQNKFETELLNICNSLSGRINSPTQRTVPNLNYLK